MTEKLQTNLVIVRGAAYGLSCGQRAAPDRVSAATSRDAAYRRLSAVILGLDVPTLASDLRRARLGATTLPRAA